MSFPPRDKENNAEDSGDDIPSTDGSSEEEDSSSILPINSNPTPTLPANPAEPEDKCGKCNFLDLNNNNTVPQTEDQIVGLSLFSHKSPKPSQSSPEGEGQNTGNQKSPRESTASKKNSILKKNSGQDEETGGKKSSKKVSMEEDKAKASVSKPQEPSAPDPGDSQSADVSEETNQSDASEEPSMTGSNEKKEGGGCLCFGSKSGGKKKSNGDQDATTKSSGSCFSKLDCFNWRCIICWCCLTVASIMFVYLLIDKCAEVIIFVDEKPMTDVGLIVFLTYFMTVFLFLVSASFIVFIKLKAHQPCWELVAKSIIFIFLMTGFTISFIEYRVKRKVPAPPELNFTLKPNKRKPMPVMMTTPSPSNLSNSSNFTDSNSSQIVTKAVYECLIDCQTFTFAMLVLGVIPYVVFILVHRKNRKTVVDSENAHASEDEEEDKEVDDNDEGEANSTSQGRRTKKSSSASQESTTDETNSNNKKKSRKSRRSSTSSRGSLTEESNPSKKKKSSRRRSFFEKRRSSDKDRRSNEFPPPLARKSFPPPTRSPRTSNPYENPIQENPEPRKSSRRRSFFEQRRDSLPPEPPRFDTESTATLGRSIAQLPENRRRPSFYEKRNSI